MRIIAWNLGRGYDNHQSAEVITRNLGKLNGDIIILPETATEDIAASIGHIATLGYDIHQTVYDDTVANAEHGRTRSETILTVLSRVAVDAEVIRPGNVRNNMLIEITKPGAYKGMTVAAVHLDDRNSERREAMAEGIIALRPNISAGDHNSLNNEDVQAMLLRTAAADMARSGIRLARDAHESRFSASESDAIVHAKLGHALRRGYEFADRLIMMAEDRTMALFEEANYQNADHRGRLALPTMKLGPLALVRLDHVLFDTEGDHFANARTYYRRGSDHLPVVADVEAKAAA